MNRFEVSTTVELGEQNKCVTMTLQCREASKLHLVHHRSALIQTILACKRDFCPKLSMSEYFLDPKDMTYPISNPEHHTLYSITEIAAVTIAGDPETHVLCCNRPDKTINVQELLFFEPYCGLGEDHIRLLFDEERAAEQVSQELILELAKRIRRTPHLYKEIIKPEEYSLELREDYIDSRPIHQCRILLEMWRAREGRRGTIQALRESIFDSHSIFCGRNPTVSSTNHL